MLKENYITMVQNNYAINQREENAREYLRNNANKKFKNKIKRFWKEWGLSKEDAGYLLGGLSIFASIIALYMILCLL